MKKVRLILSYLFYAGYLFGKIFYVFCWLARTVCSNVCSQMSSGTYHDMLLSVSIVFLVILVPVLGVYYWITFKLDYFRRRNVHYIKPSWKPIDLIRELYDVSRLLQYTSIYRSEEPHKLVGNYQYYYKPEIILRDPKLVSDVLYKDFENFSDRLPGFLSTNDSSVHFLTNVKGEKWQWLRPRLASAFSTCRLKFFLDQFDKPTTDLLAKLSENLHEPVHLFQALYRHQVHLMAFCVLGIDANVMQDENSLFHDMVKTLPSEIKTLVKKLFYLYVPTPLRLSIHGRVLDEEAETFFKQFITQLIKERRKETDGRLDFLQHFMKLMDETDVTEGKTSRWTSESTIAHCILYMLSNNTATATPLSLGLREIAAAPKIQKKLYEEFRSSLEESGGKITYDDLQGMVYLNMVVSEILRKYTINAAFLHRKCVKTCRLSNTDVIVEKGTRVILPIIAIHYDPQYYPKPEIFDPERFTEENRRKRNPNTYLPFGKGPRGCVATKFSLLNLKYAIFRIVSEFEVHLATTPAPDFPYRIPFDSFFSEVTKIRVIFRRRINDRSTT